MKTLHSKAVNTGPKAQLAIANKIIEANILAGKLTSDTEVRASGNVVLIDHLVVSRKRKGIGRQFLKELKDNGVQVDICYPKRASLPFWRKMYEEGLIPHNPDEYTTWESA